MNAEESPTYKSCPFCGEQILEVAIKCKHCGEFLDGHQSAGHQPRTSQTVVVKQKEGIFLRSLNTGCTIALIIGAIVLFSVIVILYASSSASRGGFSSGGGGSTSNSGGGGGAVVSTTKPRPTAKPAHDCTEKPRPGEIGKGNTFYTDLTERNAKIPSSFEVNPGKEIRKAATIITFRGEQSKTLQMNFSKSVNTGDYWIYDPAGNIVWTMKATWAQDQNNFMYLHCATTYRLVIGEINAPTTVTLKYKE